MEIRSEHESNSTASSSESSSVFIPFTFDRGAVLSRGPLKKRTMSMPKNPYVKKKKAENSNGPYAKKAKSNQK